MGIKALLRPAVMGYIEPPIAQRVKAGAAVGEVITLSQQRQSFSFHGRLHTGNSFPFGRLGTVDDKHGPVPEPGLPSGIHGKQEIAGGFVVFQVLNTPVGIAGVQEKFTVRGGGAAVMHGGLVQGLLILLPVLRVVAQDHLIVIVRPGHIVVHAVGHEQVGLPVGISGDLAKSSAINAAAAQPVFHRPAKVRDLGLVILHHVLQVHGGHHAVGGSVHTHPVDFVHIENGNVKGVFQLGIGAYVLQDAPADDVVFVFQGTVEPSVGVTEIDAAQMTQQTGDGADNLALQVGFHQHGGVGIVDVFPLGVQGNALAVAAVPGTGINIKRQFHVCLLTRC